MIDKKKLEKLKYLIEGSKSIAIATHVNPDGDALGSSFSLCLALKKIGKDVHVIKNSQIPEYLDFIENKDLYEDFDALKENIFDLFITLDCSELDRISIADQLFKNAKNTIVVDHHVKGGINGDLSIIYENSSSTCELVYEIIKFLNIDFDKDISSLLFTGIVTDTGRFMYENVTKDTMNVAGNLIEMNADSQNIYQNLYQKKSYNQLLMESEAVKKAEFYDNNSKVFFYISDEFVKKYNRTMSDTDPIVNILRDIDGVKLSTILKEDIINEEYKVSMRSKDDTFDVSKVARDNGGGGHKRASGFEIKTNEENALKKIRKIVKDL
ncbi:MAG: bifunctional oligoribonuclease/PAP phosphatase NrnA [Peptoniphilaceae bacterium]|nr:bifunctional oligoribonuclease/PAP phosphatase NrnA [Peptoniphilaceae bacterium]MDD7382997.1 bifunctional oligoribonuclease/PAP phosphatase NrnA [Peptoniphilaceae bacterium]MDY3737748.1 bifunctional oligoribonuclease/PAP phosphatase NrnA [Peptoniphilaceae bacterium]